MKKLLLRMSLITLLAVAAAYSQPSPTRAVIPFSFVAGGSILPAGEYTVDQTIPGVIIIKSAKQKVGAVMSTAPVQSIGAPPASSLVFHRHGSTVVLSQIWTRGDNSGRALTVKTREQELAKKIRVVDKTIVLLAE